MNIGSIKSRILIDGKCVKENDLLLKNFLRFNIIRNVASVGVTLKDEIGVDRYITGNAYPSGSKIAIGTGTTLPTRDDYKLENKVSESSTIVINELSDRAMFSTTFTLPQDTNITEVGVFVHIVAVPYPFLIIRDTFNPELFPANVPRSVTIEITI